MTRANDVTTPVVANKNSPNWLLLNRSDQICNNLTGVKLINFTFKKKIVQIIILLKKISFYFTIIILIPIFAKISSIY